MDLLGNVDGDAAAVAAETAAAVPVRALAPAAPADCMTTGGGGKTGPAAPETGAAAGGTAVHAHTAACGRTAVQASRAMHQGNLRE